jgi:ABC-type nitrate/sulfonate/bicarbonate transport system permease component
MPSVLAVVALLVAWQVVGLTAFRETHTVPTPTAILREMRNVGGHFWWANTSTTLREASRGWLWGNLLAIATAVLFVQAPILERIFMPLAVASYCLPILVLGVILTIEFEGDKPKVILAAVSVYFTTLIGGLFGLKSADRTSLDLVRAYGGGRWTQLVKVRLRASLPGLFAGLRIAAPAAILGAILGEWMGAENGLGTAMIAAQSSLEIERTWAIAIAATAVSGLAYAVTALVGNLLTPWAPRLER